MVYFSCGTCGSSLKKNQVEKHSFQCRTYGALTCIDCNKDFAGDEYKLHTKCVSEIERYSAKGWQPPANHNKGEKKQQAWLDVVQGTLDKAGNTLKPTTRNLLNTLTKHDNVPRKRPKFLNFINNVTRRQFDDRTVAEVWDLLEAQWKLEKPAPAATTNGTSNGAKKEESKPEDESGAVAPDEEDSEVPKKKKKKQKNVAEETEADVENAEAESPIPEESKKKKKKKNKHLTEESEPVVKSASEVTEAIPDPEEEGSKKKKKKRKTADVELETTEVNGETQDCLPEDPVKKKKKKSKEDSLELEPEEPVQKLKKKKKVQE